MAQCSNDARSSNVPPCRATRVLARPVGGAVHSIRSRLRRARIDLAGICKVKWESCHRSEKATSISRKAGFTRAAVGQITDYDKLSLEVWTDGSISPEDAVAYAAKIIQTQLKLFINFEDVPDEPDDKAPGAIVTTWPPGLYCSIDELELSVRSSNCLRNANIRYIWELVQRSEPEMLKTKNFGRKSLNEIKEILADKNLTLGMKLDGFEPPEEPVAAKKEDDNDEE